LNVLKRYFINKKIVVKYSCNISKPEILFKVVKKWNLSYNNCRINNLFLCFFHKPEDFFSLDCLFLSWILRVKNRILLLVIILADIWLVKSSNEQTFVFAWRNLNKQMIKLLTVAKYNSYTQWYLLLKFFLLLLLLLCVCLYKKKIKDSKIEPLPRTLKCRTT
jgi:hypothetical protein